MNLWGKTKPEVLKLTHAERLRAAVDDARTLLNFAVVTNRKLEAGIIEQLTDSVAALGDSEAESFSPGPPAEKSFWRSYDTLAVAMAPVSAASIKASHAVSRSIFGTTGLHAVFTVVLFLCLVVLEGYWFIGNNLRQELKTIESNVQRKQGLLDALRTRISKSDAERTRLVALEEQLAGAGEDNKRISRPLPTERKTRQTRIAQLEDEVSKLNEEADPVRKEIDSLRSVRAPVVELLTSWYEKVESAPWQEKYEKQIAKLRREQADRKGKSASKPSLSSFLAERTADRRAEEQISSIRDGKVIELEHRTDLLLDAMQRYVSPVLLGVLGALTFILRSLIITVREYTYKRFLLSLSFVRVCLGMMAGLLGSLFIPSTESALKGLPPLAVPFFFGYAVEVLFALMDRIVNTFTTPEK